MSPITSTQFITLLQTALDEKVFPGCSINKTRQMAKCYARVLQEEMQKQVAEAIASGHQEKTVARVSVPDIGTYIVQHSPPHQYYDINKKTTETAESRYTAKLAPSHLIKSAANGSLGFTKPRGKQAVKPK